MNTIKTKLKELRKETKLTQKEVANILGISTTAYAGYEQGYREPSIDILIKICKFYNISSDYLIGIEDYDGTQINTKNYIHTLNNNGKIKF